MMHLKGQTKSAKQQVIVKFREDGQSFAKGDTK